MSNDRVKLKIDPDGSYCMLIMDEPLTGLLASDVYDTLNENKITYGVKKKVIEDAISGKLKFERTLIIARSIPPTSGSDEYIEYLIDTESETNNSFDENAVVNLYETGFVKNVTADTILAQIHPPTIGKNGINIFGAMIPGLKGNHLQVKKFTGNGVYIDEDSHCIKALISGVYQKNHLDVISVSDELTISGNLDFSVGNIDTSSNIIIRGDIKAGFSCKTTGNIFVEGAIEDAVVESGGSIICKSGIVAGVRTVKAANEIITNYVQDRNIECCNLYVESMIFGSSIKASGEVRAKKIVGGSIICKNSITAETIGNIEHTKTMIKLGVDYNIIDKMEKTTQVIVRIKDDLKKNEQMLAKLSEDYRVCAEKIVRISELGTNNIKQTTISEIINRGKEIYAETEKLKEKNIILRTQSGRLKKEYSALVVKVELIDTTLTIKDTIYPNTTITMRLNGIFLVQNPMHDVTFYIDDNNEIIHEKRAHPKTF